MAAPDHMNDLRKR